MREVNFWIATICLIAVQITAGFAFKNYEDYGNLKHKVAFKNLSQTTIDPFTVFYTEIEIKPYINPVHPEDSIHNTAGFGLGNIPRGVYTGGALTRIHKGLDQAGVWHARIVAVADGEVMDNYYPPGNGWKGHTIYGGMIRIKHDDGRISVYAHLSATYINETDKRFVKQGQVIGRMGNTGLSAGQHLHFELWEDGQPLQPLKYIRGMK